MNRLACILFVSLLAATSCVKEHGDDLVPEPTHTLLVYMGGDNNLQTEVYQKLFALRDGWTGKENHNIVVYIDYKGSPATLLHITKDANGNYINETLAVYSYENSASAATLSRVIGDTRTLYPADCFGLLIFSHASGWLPSGTLNDPTKPAQTLSRSIIVDDAGGEMELADFADAIPDGLFDYIVFETCFMAGIEVAYELREKTPLIFASSAEIVAPGFTSVYKTETRKLLSGDVQAFGTGVFEHTLTYGIEDYHRSATYSVIRTAGLDALASFVRDNCNFTQEVDISDVQHFDRLKGYRLFFDFEDYYGRLLDTDAQRAELARLIAECVDWKAATPEFMTQSPGLNGFTIAEHSGLTTYILQTAFPCLTEAYRNLDWAGNVGLR